MSCFAICSKKCLTWETWQRFSINCISNAYFDLRQSVQNVQLCQSNPGKKNPQQQKSLCFSVVVRALKMHMKIQCIKVSHAEKPLTMWAYLTKTRSNHPQRLFLPVVTPTSLPLDCKRAPVSWISVRRTHYSAKTIADLLIGIFNYYIKFSRKHILYFLEPHSRFTLVSEYIFYYFSRTFSASYNNTCTNANIYLLREICL